MDKELLQLFDLKQHAFYFDQTKCGACGACIVACKDWNQINPGAVSRRKQWTYDWNFGQGERSFPLSMSCANCDNPACVTSCSAGAISKDPDNGIVTIDRAKCIGLKTCITACPWAKPEIADDKQEPHPINTWKIRHPAQKCTTCLGDRLDRASDKPACVLACPGRCLDFGTVEYIKNVYGNDPDFVRLNPTDFPYVYVNNKNDTGPNVYIKKMKPTGGQAGMKVHKSTIYTGKY